MTKAAAGCGWVVWALVLLALATAPRAALAGPVGPALEPCYPPGARMCVAATSLAASPRTSVPARNRGPSIGASRDRAVAGQRITVSLHGLRPGSAGVLTVVGPVSAAAVATRQGAGVERTQPFTPDAGGDAAVEVDTVGFGVGAYSMTARAEVADGTPAILSTTFRMIAATAAGDRDVPTRPGNNLVVPAAFIGGLALVVGLLLVRTSRRRTLEL